MASNRKLAKGMILVLAANIFSMAINVLLNFIQPKYLSVETYAAIKTFALYMSCSGLFHLGYEDGMYLKYGGKETNLVDKKELADNISTLRIFQLIVTGLTFIVGLVIKSRILCIFSLFLTPYNMTMYYKLLFQATGDFSLYGRILNVSSIILFALNAVFIFCLHNDEYWLYLGAYIVVYLAVWLVLEIYVNKKLKISLKIFSFSLKELMDSIKSGFFIMIGNFSSIFLTSMDRWFVKFLLDSQAFAEYGFAVSMESMLNVAVTPFTVTLYNYFCKETDQNKIIKMRNYVCILAVFIVSAAFPAKFIIDIWLPHYKEAEDVIFILFSSHILFIVVKSIYVNLYKAQKRQKEYFTKLIIVLVTGFVFNAVCFCFMRVKEAMAIGTLISAILWFILCQLDFKDIRFDFLHCIYIAVEVTVFIMAGKFLDTIPGFIFYIMFSGVLSFILLRKEVLGLFSELRKFMCKTRKIDTEIR